MSRRRAAGLAWSSVAVAFLLSALGVSAAMATGVFAGSTHLSDVLMPFALLAYSVIGALIATRQPQNPIGWTFCAMGLPSAAPTFAFGMSSLILRWAPGWLSALEPVMWLLGGMWVVQFGLIPFLLLWFPDGRLIGPRWRAVVWLNVMAIALGLLVNSSDFEIGSQILHVAGPAAPLGPDLQDNLQGLSMILLGATYGLAALSLILRWLRARGDERLQLKWFAYVGGCLALVMAVEIFLQATALLAAVDPQARYAADLFQGIPIMLAFVALPVAAGIAILKYRLYEIDVIIRRTLIYTTLTAMLALIYFGSVVLLQAGLHVLTGQQQSELVTVISTLAIAALFVPLRQRVQFAIDHRFYRRKYDAQQVLASFSASVRDEVDLNQLCEHLRSVVAETMQPTRVSLWLRPINGKREV